MFQTWYASVKWSDHLLLVGLNCHVFRVGTFSYLWWMLLTPLQINFPRQQMIIYSIIKENLLVSFGIIWYWLVLDTGRYSNPKYLHWGKIWINSSLTITSSVSLYFVLVLIKRISSRYPSFWLYSVSISRQKKKKDNNICKNKLK